MHKLRPSFAVGWSVALAFVLGTPITVSADWLHWRGPHANGSSDTAKPPLEWSETKNVRWKIPLEGLGNSTPIVLKDRVFVTTAVPTDRIDETLPKGETSFEVDLSDFPDGIYFLRLFVDKEVLTKKIVKFEFFLSRVPRDS